MKKGDQVADLKRELEKLTKLMDVPCYRYSNTKWLAKNLEKRNANHANYPKAKQLIDELVKLGA